MKLSKKRLCLITIALLIIFYAIFYYTYSWYPVRRIFRTVVKGHELKDVKAEHITIEQAKSIIGGNSSSVSLIDITPDEVFNKMGYQIFKGTNWQTYVIKNESAYRIGKSSGGWGVMDFCVADLDKDDVPELIYTYSYGSGIHRTEIGMLILGKENHEIVASTYCIGDVFLDKVDNQCVALRWIEFGFVDGYKNEYIGSTYGLYNRKVQGEILGTLVLKKTEDTNVLEVKLRKISLVDKKYIGYLKEK